MANEELNQQFTLDTAQSEQRLAKLEGMLKSLTFAVDRLNKLEIGGKAFEEMLQRSRDVQKVLAALRSGLSDVDLKLGVVRATTDSIRSSDRSSAAAIAGAKKRDALAANQYLEDSKFLDLTKMRNRAFSKLIDAAEQNYKTLVAEGKSIPGAFRQDISTLIRASQARLANQITFVPPAGAKPGSAEAAIDFQSEQLARARALQDSINSHRQALVEQKRAIRERVAEEKQAAAEVVAAEKLSRAERLRAAQEYYRDLRNLEKADVAQQKRDNAIAKLARDEQLRAAREHSRDLKQIEAEDRRAAAQARREFRASPEGRQQRIEEQRQNTLDRISGFDGMSSLFAIQARLMLNYRIMTTLTDAFQQGAQFVKEFDDNLHKLQAIASLTNPEIASLRENLMAAAEGSRFTANELAKASVLLAQAGLSAEQIGQVLKPITQLAQATGSDVGKVVDVFTSIIGVFNVRAVEAVDIANQISSALNVSKLDIDKFALAVQYAGTTAAEANIPFSEFAAVIAKVSNAGVRSGSTLGTGGARLITELVAPSEKLIKALKQVGLTEDDVNIRTKGFVAVLETLRQAGFGAEQAFASLDQRSARFLLSVNSSNQSLIELQRQILFSDAATTGSAVATKSLAAQLDVLATNAGNFAAKQGKGLVSSLTLLTEHAAKAFSWLTKLTDVLGTSSSELTPRSLATRALNPLESKLTLLLELIDEAGKSPLGRLKEISDRRQATTNSASQDYTKQREAIDAVDRSIGSLNDRYDFLSKNQDALKLETQQLNKQFADMGLSLDTSTSKVEDVIKALFRLKQAVASQIEVKLSVESSALERQRSTNRAIFNQANRDLQERGDYTRDFWDRNLGLRGRIVPGPLTDEFSAIRQALEGQDVSAVAGNDQLVQRMRSLLNKTIQQRTELIGKRGRPGEDGTQLERQIDQMGAMQTHIAEILSAVTNELNLVSKAEVNLRAQRQNLIRQFPVVRNFDKELIEYENFQQYLRQELEKAPIDKKEAIVKRLMDSKKLFSEIQKDFQGQVESVPGFDKKDLDAVMNELKSRSAMTDGRTTGVITRNIKDVAELSRRMMPILLNTVEVDIQRVQKEIEKAITRPQTTDAELKKLSDELRALDAARLTIRRENLARQKADAGKAEEREILDREEVQRSEAEARATEQRITEARIRLARTRIEEQNKLIDYQEQAFNKEIEALKSQLVGPLGKRRSADDKKKILQQIYDLMFDQMLLAMTKAVNDFLISSGLDQFATDDEGRPVLGGQRGAQSVLPDSILQKLRALYEGYRSGLARVGNQQDNRDASAGIQALSEELRAKLKQLQTEFKSISETIETINKVFEEANRQADRILGRFETRQRAMFEPQNRANFSDVNVEADNIRNRSAIERQQREAQLAAAEARFRDTQMQLERLQAARASAGRLLDEQGGRGIDKDNPDPNQDLPAHLTKILALYTQYNDQIKQLTVTQQANRQAVEDMTEQNRILASTLPSPSLLQQVADGFVVWANRVGALKGYLGQLGAEMPQVFSAISDSLGQALDSISFRTKSVSAAFADMARNILRSMISMLNQIAARAALGFLTQMLGGMFGNMVGGGGGVRSGNVGNPNDGPRLPTFMQGGWIRRAAGGSIPGTRDSKLVLTNPGEFIVNATSAAMARDELEAINSMGNRRMSRNPVQPIKMATPEPQRPLNVWMVSPDQVPPPSADDIVHAVGANMRNGGSLKVLVKQIHAGAV